jgi:membrane-bound ClpP family serine protease
MNPRSARLIPLAMGIGILWLAIRGIYQGLEFRQNLLKLDRQFTDQGNTKLVEAYDSIHTELLASLSNASLALILIGVAMTFIGIKALAHKE